MQIAITGGTGFVGSRLLPLLESAGHQVTVLTRSVASAQDATSPDVRLRTYVPYDVDSVAEALEGADAVIHLAGANLFARRWRKAYLRQIRESRVIGTQTLVRAMARLPQTPEVLLSASAVGRYGPRDPEALCREDEYDAENLCPRDALASICSAWEVAAKRAELLGMRVVRLRLGVILDRGQGALAAMQPPFKLGLGGPIGDGRQILSWIHVDDACRMIAWALEEKQLSGALNVTAPNPVSNRAFARALGRVLHRPAFVRTPALALRLLLGKVAGVITTGQRVPPLRAEAGGFTFLYPTVDDALRAAYAPKNAD